MGKLSNEIVQRFPHSPQKKTGGYVTGLCVKGAAEEASREGGRRMHRAKAEGTLWRKRV